mmetsp:Transcript_14243/g.23584  ORF Transcript_14243/g.23584 Transcript_14243/m.23584 type:complete len:272 (-) Transcript_14243:4-819(-)
MTAATEFDTEPSSWIDTLQELDPKSFLKGFFAQSTRPDGRLFSMCRPTTMTRGILQLHTVGSSLVRLGNTQVLCGVTLQIGAPSAIPNQGDVVVTAPLSQEELQRILTDMIDLSCLGIVEAQAAWRLQVTLQVLQDDGNVWDASFLAAIAALQDTRLPATQRNAKAGTMEIIENNNSNDEGTPLTFHYTPIPLTVGIYYNAENDKTHLLADPTPQEEHLLQGHMTMVVSDDDQIVHVQHASKVGLGRDQLAVCAHMAYGRGKEIRTLLKDE